MQGTTRGQLIVALMFLFCRLNCTIQDYEYDKTGHFGTIRQLNTRTYQVGIKFIFSLHFLMRIKRTVLFALRCFLESKLTIKIFFFFSHCRSYEKPKKVCKQFACGVISASKRVLLFLQCKLILDELWDPCL